MELKATGGNAWKCVLTAGSQSQHENGHFFAEVPVNIEQLGLATGSFETRPYIITIFANCLAALVCRQQGGFETRPYPISTGSPT